MRLPQHRGAYRQPGDVPDPLPFPASKDGKSPLSGVSLSASGHALAAGAERAGARGRQAGDVGYRASVTRHPTGGGRRLLPSSGGGLQEKTAKRQGWRRDPRYRHNLLLAARCGDGGLSMPRRDLRRTCLKLIRLFNSSNSSKETTIAAAQQHHTRLHLVTNVHDI